MLTGAVIGLSIAGVVAVIRSLFKVRAGGDRPIIMTGGSFHVWTPDDLTWRGRNPQQEVVYQHTSTVIRSIQFFGAQPSKPFKYPKRLSVTYQVVGIIPPNIVVVEGDEVRIGTVVDRPLMYTGQEEIDDPESMRRVKLAHREWSEDGTIIAISVVTEDGKTESIDWTGTPPKIKLHYE